MDEYLRRAVNDVELLKQRVRMLETETEVLRKTNAEWESRARIIRETLADEDWKFWMKRAIEVEEKS